MPRRRQHKHRISIATVTTVSYNKLLWLWCFIVVSSAFVYLLLGRYVPEHGIKLIEGGTLFENIMTSLYFSVVTATTIGYGDIIPQGFSRLIVMAESIVSLFLWAVFIAKLVTHKQEIALYQVHKMSFESMFIKTRENLFIMRKDFEEIIASVKKAKKMTTRSRQNMITACKHGQTIMEEIVKFYGDETHIYTIDYKREELLLEAVRRTLDRLMTLIRTLKQYNIDCIEDAEVAHELKVLIEIVAVTLPLWKEISHDEQHDIFGDIETLSSALMRVV